VKTSDLTVLGLNAGLSQLRSRTQGAQFLRMRRPLCQRDWSEAVQTCAWPVVQDDLRPARLEWLYGNDPTVVCPDRSNALAFRIDQQIRDFALVVSGVIEDVLSSQILAGIDEFPIGQFR
jgi:hypothetical protein